MYYDCMYYDVNEKKFASNKLVLTYIDDSFDGPSKESIVMEIDEFFSGIKKDIKSLYVKELLLKDGNCLICSIVKENTRDHSIYYSDSKNEQIQNSIIYALVGEYNSKLNEYKLFRQNNIYKFNDNLISNEYFRNALDDLLIYYARYKDSTYQKINYIETKEASISQILENTNNIYEDCKDIKASNLKLGLAKEEAAKAYQLICSSEYIKSLIEKEYSFQDLILTDGIAFGGLIGPLIGVVAEKMNIPGATAIGIITAVAVPLLCVSGLQIKNKKIEEEYINILENIKNRMKEYYDLVYDESTNEVVDSKTFQKVLN